MSDDDAMHGAFSGKMHTAYKHEILTKYLPAWMQILQAKNRTIAYVDCFAGPGIYPDGSKGSPHIALDVANSISSKYGCQTWCIFNDKDEKVIKKLLNSLQDRSDDKQVSTFSFQADAREFIEIILNDKRFAQDGRLSVPMFFFIDPFGLSLPMEMLKKIMEQSKTEILMTFMIKDVVRWGKTPAYEKTMIEIFDHPEPLSIIKQADGRNREQQSVNAFVTRLHNHIEVKFVNKVRICSDTERRTLFYLVHGSNHFMGFKLMKDIMYNMGIPGTFAYLGPDQPDEYQTHFDTWDSDVQHLMNHLTRKYLDQTTTYNWIIEDTYADVPYIEKHFREALKRLEKEGSVKISGLRGKRGGFKSGTIFEFIKEH